MSNEQYQNARKKRVVWSDDCVHELLNVFEDKQIIKHLDGSRYRNEGVFRMAAAELNRRHNGANTFTVPEIRVKWKSLKKMFRDAKFKNETSGHNKVTKCKFYDRLTKLLGNRTINNSEDTGGDSSFVVNDTKTIHDLEENCLEEISTNEENRLTNMDSIYSQSIIIPKEEYLGDLPRSSECITKWSNSSSKLDYLKQISKVQTVEDSPELLFLKSLIPDFKKLNNKNQRRFKTTVLNTLDLLLDEQEPLCGQ